MPIGLNNISPGDPISWFGRRLADLERKVRELAAAPTLQNASISQGGIAVRNGGAVTVVDADGHTVALIGALPAAYNRADGSPQPGVAFYREDGSVAAFLGDLSATVAPYKQAWQTFDRAGNVLSADDANSGTGISWPLLNLGGFVDIGSGTVQTTTSAAYVDLQWAASIRQHPRIAASILVRADAATTGAVQIVDGAGNVIGTPIAVAAGAFTQVTLGPVAWPTGTWQFNEGITQLRLQAQRLTGTGAVGGKVVGAWGWPS